MDLPVGMSNMRLLRTEENYRFYPPANSRVSLLQFLYADGRLPSLRIKDSFSVTVKVVARTSELAVVFRALVSTREHEEGKVASTYIVGYITGEEP